MSSMPSRHTRELTVVAAVSAALIVGLSALSGNGTKNATAGTAAPVASTAPAQAPAAGQPAADVPLGLPADVAPAATTTTTIAGDVGGEELGACTLKERSVRPGQSGADVSCLQEALVTNGLMSGTPSGSYDAATQQAVEKLQTDKNLYVDGIVGRETAIELGIWPDEASLVTRTPKPPAGAVDLMGYPLSSVASAGADAPPLPPDSGSGRRLVYSRAGQRVWAVNDDGDIVRSWLVSGSKYNNELPGTHEVYSRSDVSTAWNGKAFLPQMVRWLKTQRGAIGFHSIPLHVEDNSPYQTEDELGQRLSGGCQRQAPRDAAFLWDFAQVGTKVVVV
jgi:peptidoglycan hydrolase-like protein with peptidoglycan-binding domain